jgi:hypothetical protein
MIDRDRRIFSETSDKRFISVGKSSAPIDRSLV